MGILSCIKNENQKYNKFEKEVGKNEVYVSNIEQLEKILIAIPEKQ